ncbi:MAG: DUF4136 domain-containing protein [Polyangiaceae bacterium]|jgi:hypothetical protein
MKTTAWVTTLVLVSTLAGGCYSAANPGPQIQTTASPSAPVAEYRTFSFGWAENPPTTDQASARALEVERHMRGLVGAALRQKGYVEETVNPNFLVRFTAGTEVKLATFNDEADPQWSMKEVPVELEELKVDIYDSATKAEVWRGSAISEIDLTKGIDDRLLQHDVQSLLASFPVRRAPGEPAPNPLAKIDD